MSNDRVTRFVGTGENISKHSANHGAMKTTSQSAQPAANSNQGSGNQGGDAAGSTSGSPQNSQSDFVEIAVLFVRVVIEIAVLYMVVKWLFIVCC